MSRLWSKQIKNDPLAFVLLAFPWGAKGTPLEHFTEQERLQLAPPQEERAKSLLQSRSHVPGETHPIVC
jgi:hypothetical protein